jgi:hypothetical protein
LTKKKGIVVLVKIKMNQNEWRTVLTIISFIFQTLRCNKFQHELFGFGEAPKPSPLDSCLFTSNFSPDFSHFSIFFLIRHFNFFIKFKLYSFHPHSRRESSDRAIPGFFKIAILPSEWQPSSVWSSCKRKYFFARVKRKIRSPFVWFKFWLHELLPLT